MEYYCLRELLVFHVLHHFAQIVLITLIIVIIVKADMVLCHPQGLAKYVRLVFRFAKLAILKIYFNVLFVPHQKYLMQAFAKFVSLDVVPAITSLAVSLVSLDTSNKSTLLVHCAQRYLDA
jgi:hypothetical protein